MAAQPTANNNVRNKEKVKRAAVMEDFLSHLAVKKDGQCQKMLPLMPYTRRATTKTPTTNEKNNGTLSSKKVALAKGRGRQFP